MKRRDFIKSTMIGSAALAVVPVSLISAEEKTKPVTAWVDYNDWNRPIYPDIREWHEKGMVSTKGFSESWDGNDRDKYHLMSYVPNKHDATGYSLCRRTHIISNPNLRTIEHIKNTETDLFIEDCERVLKNPENYVYIKEL